MKASKMNLISRDLFGIRRRCYGMEWLSKPIYLSMRLGYKRTSDLLYDLFTLNYQYFNEVSQQPDAHSKEWTIIPTSLDTHPNINISNKILYLSVHMPDAFKTRILKNCKCWKRIFEADNLDK